MENFRKLGLIEPIIRALENEKYKNPTLIQEKTIPAGLKGEQIMVNLKRFSRYKPLNIVTVYGGVSINPQIHSLIKADVVVATPGRILDHLQRRTINLSRVKILVLDEADKMLDMGFIEDVVEIIKKCPK